MGVLARERKVVGELANLGLARAVALGGVLVVALALQSTLLPLATLLGVIPQLVLVVTVTVAYLEGERLGVAAGFAGGLLMDLLVPAAPVGIHALVYAVVGAAVATLRQSTQTESVWTPVLIVAIASAAAEIGYSALSIMFGQPWVSLAYTAKVAGLVVLYNTLLTPFTFPLVRRVSNRFGPAKVLRW